MREIETVFNITKKYDFTIKWRLTDDCNYKCSYCARWDLKDHIREEKSLSIDEKTEYLSEVAGKINALLERNPQKERVKIDLVGGECSIFDLEKILSPFTTKQVKCFSMTTNFSRSVEYYVSLYNFLKDRGIILFLTCSFHPEYVSFDDFIEKVQAYRAVSESCKCEFVLTEENQDICSGWIDRFNELEIPYKVDADMRKKEIKFRREISDKIKSNQSTRYLVLYDDESSCEFVSRNNFLSHLKTPDRWFSAGGFYCTNSYDYIYIEYDWVIGRKGKLKAFCNLKYKIDDFELLNEPLICNISTCSLCGNMSLSKDKEKLMHRMDYMKDLERKA